MNGKVVTATCAVALLVLGAGAEARDKGGRRAAAKECAEPSASVGQSARAGAPQTITGEVVKIDQNSGMVTLRAADGTTHEFRANKQTLRDLKIGDNLEAKLRTTNC